jgi:hypothetical protein
MKSETKTANLIFHNQKVKLIFDYYFHPAAVKVASKKSRESEMAVDSLLQLQGDRANIAPSTITVTVPNPISVPVPNPISVPVPYPISVPVLNPISVPVPYPISDTTVDTFNLPSETGCQIYPIAEQDDRFAPSSLRNLYTIFYINLEITEFPRQ